MNFDSFSHGQIVSKIWLCEELEDLLPENPNVYILGGWHNVLGFMLLTRNQHLYKSITNIDLDTDAVEVADKITNTWSMDSTVKNIVGDANTLAEFDPDLVINCSVEHFENNDWFNQLKPGTMVCIQSSDMTDPNDPWFIRQPNPTLTSFINRFPVSKTLFIGSKRIQYPHFGYNRFMLIGRI